jgi:uncharacterized delta-60 repeat protein
MASLLYRKPLLVQEYRTMWFNGSWKTPSSALRSWQRPQLRGRSAAPALYLERLESRSLLRPRFGKGGLVTTDFTGNLSTDSYAVALQPNGKIVVAGSANNVMALARYNPDGRLDKSFGSGGEVTTSFGGEAKAYAVTLQNNGKIVAGGYAASSTFGAPTFALARYTQGGTLDTTFGTASIITTSYIGQYNGIAIQIDDKIVVASLASDNPPLGVGGATSPWRGTPPAAAWTQVSVPAAKSPPTSSARSTAMPAPLRPSAMAKSWSRAVALVTQKTSRSHGTIARGLSTGASATAGRSSLERFAQR